MKKYIKQRLREGLEYHHVSDATKDEYVIDEISIPSLSLSQKVALTDEDRLNLAKLKAEQIDFEQLSTTSPVKLRVVLPWENDLEKGIALDLQLVKDALFQIHISMDENLQSYGLGYKIYKALILQFGHLYSGKGRRQNNVQVPKIWNKLNSEPGITCHSNKHMDACILDANPDKEGLKKLLNIS